MQIKNRTFISDTVLAFLPVGVRISPHHPEYFAWHIPSVFPVLLSISIHTYLACPCISLNAIPSFWLHYNVHAVSAVSPPPSPPSSM